MTKILFNHKFDSTNSFRCYNLKTIRKILLTFVKQIIMIFFYLFSLSEQKYSIFQFPMKIYGLTWTFKDDVLTCFKISENDFSSFLKFYF